ncbi:MAG: aldo/keto reductase [Gemmatimonadota bacterium]|nr:aldo/keto reductase [Gemmatimonadota bacterium]
MIESALGSAVALTLSPLDALARQLAQSAPLIERAIPSSGEKIPIIGIGTARRYDVATAPEARAPLAEVLKRFPEMGGKVLDTAPSYGAAESVIGDITSELGNRSKLFLATKVAMRGGGSDLSAATRQMEDSMRRLHTDRIDLMQVHNLGNVELLLPLLREWKAAKRIRYIGVTTGSENQHDALVRYMETQPMDFIQVNYSVDSRSAATRVLPLAADKGIAVLIDLPFGRTTVFQKVNGKPLPDWAAEIDCATWAQVFLKYIVSTPGVTCAIPGTAKVEYLVDNLGAARGRMPDAAMRKKIEAFFDGQ